MAKIPVLRGFDTRPALRNRGWRPLTSGRRSGHFGHYNDNRALPLSLIPFSNRVQKPILARPGCAVSIVSDGQKIELTKYHERQQYGHQSR